MSAHRCTVTVQGYGGPVEHVVKCLPHTGSDLSPFVLFAVAIVACGILLRLVARPGRRRRKEWHRFYRAGRDDWERPK